MIAVNNDKIKLTAARAYTNRLAAYCGSVLEYFQIASPGIRRRKEYIQIGNAEAMKVDHWTDIQQMLSLFRL